MNGIPTYYELHKARLLRYQNEYYSKNKEKCLKKQKQYNINNKGKIQQYYNGYYYPCIVKNKISLEKGKELLTQLRQNRINKLKNDFIVSL